MKTETAGKEFLRIVAGNILRSEIGNRNSLIELHIFNRRGENRRPGKELARAERTLSNWARCDKAVGRRDVGPTRGWENDCVSGTCRKIG
jgi:hypothetical protein